MEEGMDGWKRRLREEQEEPSVSYSELGLNQSWACGKPSLGTLHRMCVENAWVGFK